jgi:hypothetical protein
MFSRKARNLALKINGLEGLPSSNTPTREAFKTLSD